MFRECNFEKRRVIKHTEVTFLFFSVTSVLFCFFEKKFHPLIKKWGRGVTKRTRERVVKAKRTVNIFEVSKRDKPQYFVDKVKDKRRTKNT